MESKIHCKVKQAKYNEVHNITTFVQNRRQKSVSFWFVYKHKLPGRINKKLPIMFKFSREWKQCMGKDGGEIFFYSISFWY